MRKVFFFGLAMVGLVAASSCSGLFRSSACQQTGSTMVCGEARFDVLSPTLVRMEFSPERRFVDAPTAVVTGREWPAAKVSFKRQKGWLVATTSSLTLRYRLGSGRFTPKNLQIDWKENGEQHGWAPDQADSLNLGGVSYSLDGARKGHFPDGPPGVLSRSGYFLLDDSASPVWDKQTQWIAPRPDANDQDWYFLEYGHDYAAALKEYAQLCGRIPMVPRYVLGSMITDLNYEFLPQSDLVKNYKYSDKDVEKLVTRLRGAGIPLDVLVLDFAWHNYGWEGGYDWSPLFPHPDQFLHWAHQQGLKISLNDHPGYADFLHDKTVLSDSDTHAAEVRRQLKIPPDHIIRWNLARKQQAKVFMKDLHFPLMDQGVDFWWVDGGAGAAKMAGLNPQMWTNRVYYDFSEQHTGKRAFIMSRYGGGGSHRYPGFFTGDTHSEWDVLSYEVGFTARGGNVFEPYITHDIGGFLGKGVPFDLYARWVEFGAFSPLLRLHSQFENPRDGNLRMPWTYGQEGVALVRRYFQLRYRLLPYIYTYSRIAYDDGLPIVRPLYLEDPSIPDAYAYPDEYFFGKEMLVAPITDPAGETLVYLPPGTWTDYFTGKTYPGEQVLRISAPTDVIPVFVKTGSILPIAPVLAYSDEKPLDRMGLDIFGPDPGSFRLYEDDGTSLAYRKGASAWTPIAFQKESPSEWKVTIGPADGQFAGQVSSRAWQIAVHGLPDEVQSVRVDGRALRKSERATPGWFWDAQRSIAVIHLDARSVRSVFEVTLSTAR
jgi:alpha-glucosidase (family GH31 glycosyl hydrolase)